ncbi:MAG: YegS/Rv2252/BmrU family lipid kinase [Actinomycetes bacterium]
MKIAVVAHRKKSLGGGLGELRRVLADLGLVDVMWFEVPKSKKAPKKVKQAVEAGVDRVFVWGGDGTVQRCLDVLAGSDVSMAVLPAGTGNLFATNLGIPIDLEKAAEIGARGNLRRIDVGRVNGERFGVMAGVGADAQMIQDADRGLKDRLGRGAYVFTGLKGIRDATVKVKVDVDGKRFYSGKAGSVLVGNVGKLMGGVEAFDDAEPDDGKLDVGVVTATTPTQWGRVVARATTGRTANSKYVRVTNGTRIKIRLKGKRLYQVDGGDREKVQQLKLRVEPAALSVCVPADRVSG